VDIKSTDRPLSEVNQTRLFQHMPRNHQLLDLAGAFIQPEQPDITK
jgi:hypothetical protein